MKKLFTIAFCALLALGSCTNSSTSEKKSACDGCDVNKEELVLVLNMQRKVKPESVASFKASFEKCKVSTLKEEACIIYDMYQSYTDSTFFFITETWKNKEGHRYHMTLPHFDEHMKDCKGISAEGFSPNNQVIYVCPEVN